jgi:hypothetical protein
MHEMLPLQHVARQIVEERRRQAERDALAVRHSRAGLMRRFLEAVARRGAR